MRALLLFAKRPRPGRVKTRLVPPLSSVQALALSRAMLTDQLAFVERQAGACGGALLAELWTDGPWESEDGPRGRLPLRQQGDGDLGRRMARAFAAGHAAGARVTAILGGDAPTLPAERVVEAFELVETGAADAAVVPAADGGYVLLALERPRGELLHEVPWGTAELLACTRRNAAAAGLRLGETEAWYDVDSVADLLHLRRELGSPAARARAPATAAVLDGLELDALTGRVV